MTDPSLPQADDVHDEGRVEGRVDRLVARLEPWLRGVRAVPRTLDLMLYGSIGSGLLLAWSWFLSSSHGWVRWLAVPWLLLTGLPQLGMWVLSRTIRELLQLPERLRSLKKDVADHGRTALKAVRGVEIPERPPGGFFRRVREALRLHGELGAVLGTRALLARLTGRLAILIGPVSIALNIAIILVGVLQLWLMLR